MSANNSYSTIYETNYFTKVIVKVNPSSVIDTYSTVTTKKNDISINTDDMIFWYVLFLTELSSEFRFLIL